MISYQRYGEAAVLAPPEAPAPERQKVATRYHHRGYALAKRAIDIVLSAAMLVVLFPILFVVSALIAITEGFPVVFRQKRIGMDGKEFFIYKFRTMVKNAEEILQNHPELMEEYRRTYKITNDPRISKLGRFLRKTSLDELPQLLNVLYGEMSLVGPRPIVPKEIEKYGDWSWVYLSMKPGCGGLWQCSGRSDIGYEERVLLDVHYYERASVWYDLKLMFKTAWDVVRCRGAA